MEDLVLLGKINKDNTISAIPCSWQGFISKEGYLIASVEDGVLPSVEKGGEPLFLLRLGEEGYRQRDWNEIVEYNKKKDAKFVGYTLKNIQEYDKKLRDYKYLFIFYEGHCFMKSKGWILDEEYLFSLNKKVFENNFCQDNWFIKNKNWPTPKKYAALLEKGITEEFPWSDLSQWFLSEGKKW